MSKGKRTDPGYKVGDICTYVEDDWEAQVKLIDVDHDAEWERYVIKVIKTIHASNIFDTPPDGTETKIDRRWDYGGCWYLKKL